MYQQITVLIELRLLLTIPGFFSTLVFFCSSWLLRKHVESSSKECLKGQCHINMCELLFHTRNHQWILRKKSLLSQGWHVLQQNMVTDHFHTKWSAGTSNLNCKNSTYFSMCLSGWNRIWNKHENYKWDRRLSFFHNSIHSEFRVAEKGKILICQEDRAGLSLFSMTH